MAEKVIYHDPAEYSQQTPLHIVFYGYNGVGKTTFAGGGEEVKTVLLDCGDAGAITLRNKKNVRIVRIRNIFHFLDVTADLCAKSGEVDLVVVDTLTGLQSRALKEVKPKRTFDMNRRKWGQVSSRIIECISEIDSFPNDLIYLIQEKKRGSGEDGEGEDNTSPALMPSIKGFMNGLVDWVGWISIEDSGQEGVAPNRYVDFRLTEHLEAKDRASLFPKRIKNPTYSAIRKRIMTELKKVKEEKVNA